MKLTEQNYVEEAERVMQEIRGGKTSLSTTKIRNLLSMISDIYNDVRYETGDKLSRDILSRIQYLKVHIVYDAGREKSVKEFVQKADLLKQIDEIGNSRAQFLLFCHYMEALVAYWKYFGGKD